MRTIVSQAWVYFLDLFVSIEEEKTAEKGFKKKNELVEWQEKRQRQKKGERRMIAILVIKLIMGIGSDRVYFGVRENVCFPVQRNPPKGVRVLR